jgi:predicted acyltransferase
MSVSSSSVLPAQLDSPEPSAKTGRLLSLDVFRGATMALMVLVNNGGGPGSYSQLEHSSWNGWTITDCVFPSFLWIVGVAITLSLSKRLAAGVPRSKIAIQTLRRAAIIYCLGLLVYLYPEFHFGTMRVLGVLQRIAICYLIASLIYLTTSLRGQILWILGLMSSYWLFMKLAPVPGYGAGHLDVQGNFAHYIDQIILGKHNYADTKTWDPEGIISTIPAIATAIFGLLAGRILQWRREIAARSSWMFVIGGLLLIAALICNEWLPINKKLWSDSFALWMAGLDFMIFAGLLWIVDGEGHRRFTKPFSIIGMNAITIYMISELLAGTIDAIRVGSGSLQQAVYHNAFASWAGPANASLLYALSYVLLMYACAYAMYRKGWDRVCREDRRQTR